MTSTPVWADPSLAVLPRLLKTQILAAFHFANPNLWLQSMASIITPKDEMKQSNLKFCMPQAFYILASTDYPSTSFYSTSDCPHRSFCPWWDWKIPCMSQKLQDIKMLTADSPKALSERGDVGSKPSSRAMGFHWILQPVVSKLLEETSSKPMGPNSCGKPQKQLTIKPL